MLKKLYAFLSINKSTAPAFIITWACKQEWGWAESCAQYAGFFSLTRKRDIRDRTLLVALDYLSPRIFFFTVNTVLQIELSFFPNVDFTGGFPLVPKDTATSVMDRHWHTSSNQPDGTFFVGTTWNFIPFHQEIIFCFHSESVLDKLDVVNWAMYMNGLIKTYENIRWEKLLKCCSVPFLLFTFCLFKCLSIFLQ